MSASVLVYPGEVAKRIEFKGGMARNNYRGKYSTDDPAIQKAIESCPMYGDCINGQIYFSESYGAPEVKKTEEAKEVVEEVKVEVPKPVTGFKEVKQLLIEKHGVSPDDVKNMPQLKKKVKELNLPYVV